MRLTYKVEPMAHQRQGVEKATPLDYFAYFFEQGCGKTFTAINIMRMKWGLARRPLRTLIFCPAIVIENWRREIVKFSNIEDSSIALLEGSAWKRLCAFDGTPPPILITNYESLLMEKLFKKFQEWEPELVIFDESQKLKAMTSKRTKLALKLSEKAQFRYLLSGTPDPQGLEDYFSQYLILDRGKALGTNLRDFRQEFFIDENRHMPRHVYFPKWVPRMNAEEMLATRISATSMAIKKEDCLDLPPLVRQRVNVVLNDEQRKAYDEVEKDFVTELKTGQWVVTDLEMTKAMRMMQIANGFVTTEDGSRVGFAGHGRGKVLAEVLEEIGRGHQVLVWAVFRQNYEDIAAVFAKLGRSWTEIHGEVPQAKRQERVDAFQRGDFDFMLTHPRSAGIGINLTAASYSVFYSRNFNREDDLQAEARNHRIGSERHSKITRIDLAANGTIDEVALDSHQAKAAISDAVANHLKLRQQFGSLGPPRK